MPSDAVFLSYAREDLDHARRVVAAFERAGIDVWFDEQRLAGGVDWDQTIQDCIRIAPAMTVPVAPALATPGPELESEPTGAAPRRGLGGRQHLD